jgi:hypothetical protein
MLARAGHLNRKDSPGIKHAKTLVTRPKSESVRHALSAEAITRRGSRSFRFKAALSRG